MNTARSSIKRNLKNWKWMRLFALILSVVLLGAVTACSNKGNGADAATTADNAPVELVVYSTSAMPVEQFNQLYGDPVHKKFPNYTIKYIQYTKDVTLQALSSQGQTIDLYWDSINPYYNLTTQYGLQYDMTDLIKKHGIDLNRFEPTLIDAAKMISTSGIAALPVLNTNFILVYNKDVFDKFGVPYPKDGITWDDLQNLSKQLTKTTNGVQYTALSTDIAHFIRLNQLSAPYVDPKTIQAAINNDAWNAKWKSIFDTLGVLNNPLPSHDNFFKDKTLAMYISGSNTFLDPTAFTDLNWDVVSYPVLKNAPGIGSQPSPIYFGVTSISQHKDQAMEVLKYWTSDEFQMQFSKEGAMTVLKNTDIQKAFGQDTVYKGKNLQAVFYDKLAPIAAKTLYDDSAEKSYKNYETQWSTGQLDLNTAFRKIEDEVNKNIAAAKQAGTGK